MIIGGFVSFILLLWMILRIWKESTLLAIVSLFFWPALVYAVVKNWGDEESDIKVPFFFFMVATVYAWYDMSQLGKAAKEQEDALLSLAQLFA